MNEPKGSYAVKAQRKDPRDTLDFFPTPPWATRALIEVVIDPAHVAGLSCWEPAAGEGHMAETLRPYFARLHASDVHDYGRGYDVGSFTGGGLLAARCPFKADWIMTNPPFNAAADFLERALDVAAHGVALLVRTAWLESEERWRRIFRNRAPSTVAQFAERVPMQKGSWNPDGSTATAYAWFVWERDSETGFTRHGEARLVWIPPGAEGLFTHKDDRARFAAAAGAATDQGRSA